MAVAVTESNYKEPNDPDASSELKMKNSHDIYNILQNGTCIIVDVRGNEEYLKSSLINSINIPPVTDDGSASTSQSESVDKIVIKHLSKQKIGGWGRPWIKSIIFISKDTNKSIIVHIENVKKSMQIYFRDLATKLNKNSMIPLPPIMTAMPQFCCLNTDYSLFYNQFPFLCASPSNDANVFNQRRKLYPNAICFNINSGDKILNDHKDDVNDNNNNSNNNSNNKKGIRNCSIFLGAANDAKNSYVIKDLGITHIINCCPKTVGCLFNGNDNNSDYENFNVKYCVINIEDVDNVPIGVFFQYGINFVEKALNESNKMQKKKKKKKNVNILIHCAEGISRSATILASYLMFVYKWSLDETLTLIRKHRPIISPNEGFMQYLKAWESEIKSKSMVFVEENKEKDKEKNEEQTSKDKKLKQIDKNNLADSDTDSDYNVQTVKPDELNGIIDKKIQLLDGLKNGPQYYSDEENMLMNNVLLIDIRQKETFSKEKKIRTAINIPIGVDLNRKNIFDTNDKESDVAIESSDEKKSDKIDDIDEIDDIITLLLHEMSKFMFKIDDTDDIDNSGPSNPSTEIGKEDTKFFAPKVIFMTEMNGDIEQESNHHILRCCKYICQQFLISSHIAQIEIFVCQMSVQEFVKKYDTCLT